MNFLNIQEEIEDVKLAIKNQEYQYAKLKITSLLESEELTDVEKTSIFQLQEQTQKYFETNSQQSLNMLFLKAFFDDLFLANYFMAWFNEIIKTEIFQLNQEQLKTLANFFVNEKISNFDKCFVLESLAVLKINLDVKFLNNKLKTLDQVNTLQLKELSSHQQKDQILIKLEELAAQDPSAKNLAVFLTNTLYAYCFPMKINFDTQEIAQYIYDYVISKLELEKSQQFSQNINKKLIDFLQAIFEEQPSDNQA